MAVTTLPLRPPADPVELAAVVLQNLVTLRQVAPSEDSVSWSAAQREAVIGVLDKVATQLSLYKGEVLATHKDSGQWAGRGDRTFDSWRSRTGRQTAGETKKEIVVAEGANTLPKAKEATEQGQIAMGHLEVLARLKANASRAVQRALLEGGEEHLTSLAARNDVTTFAARAKTWAARIDAAALENDREAAHEQRSLRMALTANGLRYSGTADPVAGAKIKAAFEALMGRPATDDERSHDQRMADAFEAMADRVLGEGQDKVGAQLRPHLAILVREETWTAMRRRRWFLGGAGSSPDGVGPVAGCDGTTGLPPAAGPRGVDGLGRGVPAAELEDGTLIAESELERLACDCEITRIVMNALGEPLDVGRDVRTYDKQLRRAVLARDRHCQWPGCATRGSWCEVHHIIYWENGGPTSLGNAITLCCFHHHEVHRKGIGIIKTPAGFRFTARGGRVIGTSSRIDDILLCPRSLSIAGRVPTEDALGGGSSDSHAQSPPSHSPSELEGGSPLF